MSPSAVIRPHCGAARRRDPRDLALAAETRRRAEARPRLAASEAGAPLAKAPDEDPGFWRHLLPSRGLAGWAFALDAMLVVLTLPLIAGIFVTPRSRRSASLGS